MATAMMMRTIEKEKNAYMWDEMMNMLRKESDYDTIKSIRNYGPGGSIMQPQPAPTPTQPIFRRPAPPSPERIPSTPLVGPQERAATQAGAQTDLPDFSGSSPIARDDWQEMSEELGFRPQKQKGHETGGNETR